MKKFDLVPLIAIFMGLTVIIVAISYQGSLLIFWSLSSMLITILGSFAALMASYPHKVLLEVPKILRQAFISPMDNRSELVDKFSKLSRKARSEGLLSLEEELESVEDEFLMRGLQMVVDGIEPDSIKEIMNLEVETVERRHGVGHNIFKSWGELAPAFGMIGTLIGLIIMLSDLSDSSAIGVGMATALITTFYGALLANLVLIPISTKLQSQTEEEIFTRDMMIEGVLSIQSGTNPRIIEEKLSTYLSPKERNKKAEKEVEDTVTRDAS
ncbi:MAG TPA: MotA/TolQ/ExbB proton channel family protein [Clostridia bacterium]|nr:MotA/TolQ/ExbB proton channel family protein [Clostridia bacterium]